MKANVLYAVNNLRYVDVPTPSLKQGEVLVKVRAAGICGSDIARVFKTGTYHFPTIIGHEFAGEVCDTSDKESQSWIGKRVSVFPLKPCFSCPSCQEGHYEMCSHYDYLGSRCDGGFADYVAVPAWNLLELPASVSFEEAAMMEPASVAMHALRQSGLKPGDTVVVIGPGTIGMILCRMAKLFGASKVVLVGRTQSKLDFARRYGIEYVCNSQEEKVGRWISERLDSEGVDIAFEGTGSSQSLQTCMEIVKPAGTVLVYGNPSDDVHLDKAVYWRLLRKQLQLKGTWNSRYGAEESDWKAVLSLLEKGALDLKNLITHRLPMERLADGLRIMRDNTIYSNKIILENHD